MDNTNNQHKLQHKGRLKIQKHLPGVTPVT